ncbi:uncharacterized protein LOC143456241 [Clavelina lepadiformis]|uniref:Cilia- and flagella-associated protein 97 n=1 Tax=Clavelina lepadiformis TaxID=159417 RepID=A0ABP0H2S3_CLALP
MEEAIDFDFFDGNDSDGVGTGSSISTRPTGVTYEAVKANDNKHRHRSHNSRSTESHSSSDSETVTSNNHHSQLHGTNESDSNMSCSAATDSSKKIMRRESTDDTSCTDSERNVTSSGSEISKAERHGHSNANDSENSSKRQQRPSKKSRDTSNVKSHDIQADGDGFSSDSVTDVSPLTSPDGSPQIRRRGANENPSNETFHNTSSNEAQNSQVRHITKLNVTFKNSSSMEKMDKSRHNSSIKKNSQRTSSLRKKSPRVRSPKWKKEYLSDSDDDFGEHHHQSGHEKQGLFKTRQQSAMTDHRRRLLDSAARGSMDISSLLETVLEFEQKNYNRQVTHRMHQPMNYRIGDNLIHRPEHFGRKNMSFTNDKVREIDQENQRLLKQITRQSRPSSASSVRSNASYASNTSLNSKCSSRSTSSRLSRMSSGRRPSEKPVKLYHTAINRIQQQRQIERENMQLLKRLNSAKATPGMQRQRQLADHKRQAEYIGTTIDRNGMSTRKANELTRNAEVVQEVMGLRESRRKPVRPAWQESW